ncbi:hypothetical protein PRIPAC_83913 [Pristionchus pacificus]|uniref:Sm domain-containing protein n=1 Tax=Pristionchus pacificus TaxID=54126 RepID=A0A2A6BMN5_PRIPA|nr:hypothetical protein PRIPAC_83913 [Pristionchus pacificus]|eukprot:PDM67167.1 hypothetical protein PRIPAC_48584 [Pristionchus pacificus]
MELSCWREIMNESRKMREGMASFIAGLAGKKVLVELRGDKYANGTLESCDCYLNLRMSNVTMDQGGKNGVLREFFIRGKHIRFIHMDKYEDVVAAVRRGIRASKD